MRLNKFNIILIVIAIAPQLGFGQSAAKSESETFTEAKEILQNMSNFLSSADKFSFNANMAEDRQYDKDYYIQSVVTSEVTIKRPDKVYADIKGDFNHKRYWYDGKSITLLTIPANFYATAKATGNIDVMTNFVYENFGVHIPLVALAYKNPFEVLTEGVTDGYYTGLQTVEGMLCHHLLFIEEDAVWEIWIKDGPVPVPVKYVIKYTLDDMEYRFSATIENWDFNGFAPDEMFNFTPPSGASEIEFIK